MENLTSSNVRCSPISTAVGDADVESSSVAATASAAVAAKNQASYVYKCMENHKRRRGSLSIDAEDLDFLGSHVHGLRPFWGDHRPWCVDHLEYVSRVLMRILGSLTHKHDVYFKLRSRHASGLSCLILIILQLSGIYERHPDITSIDHFQIDTARKDLCYV
ncbi:hypothetical protein OROGR_010464 [Orobanche gracilis]